MTITNNMTFKIAGAAGQGVESSGAGFAQALARGGLHLFGLQDYMSRIRGGSELFPDPRPRRSPSTPTKTRSTSFCP